MLETVFCKGAQAPGSWRAVPPTSQIKHLSTFHFTSQGELAFKPEGMLRGGWKICEITGKKPHLLRATHCRGRTAPHPIPPLHLNPCVTLLGSSLEDACFSLLFYKKAVLLEVTVVLLYWRRQSSPLTKWVQTSPVERLQSWTDTPVSCFRTTGTLFYPSWLQLRHYCPEKRKKSQKEV